MWERGEGGRWTAKGRSCRVHLRGSAGRRGSGGHYAIFMSRLRCRALGGGLAREHLPPLPPRCNVPATCAARPGAAREAKSHPRCWHPWLDAAGPLSAADGGGGGRRRLVSDGRPSSLRPRSPGSQVPRRCSGRNCSLHTRPPSSVVACCIPTALRLRGAGSPQASPFDSRRGLSRGEAARQTDREHLAAALERAHLQARLLEGRPPRRGIAVARLREIAPRRSKGRRAWRLHSVACEICELPRRHSMPICPHPPLPRDINHARAATSRRYLLGGLGRVRSDR